MVTTKMFRFDRKALHLIYLQNTHVSILIEAIACSSAGRLSDRSMKEPHMTMAFRVLLAAAFCFLSHPWSQKS
jgi:hypothetical protein